MLHRSKEPDTVEALAVLQVDLRMGCEAHAVLSSRDLPLVAVVCDDRADERHAVGQLLGRCGFELGGAADGYVRLREMVQTLQPTVAVVTLPLPGMNGLRAVRDLLELAPHCQIVLLSAFGQLDGAAVEAGATALVPEDDLKALQHVLAGIARAGRRADVSVPGPRAQDVPSTPTVA